MSSDSFYPFSPYEGSAVGDGQARSILRPPFSVRSPYDRAPDRKIVDFTKIPAIGAAQPLDIPFAGWCSWVHCEQDGGASTLLVYPGKARSSATIALRTGQNVYLGDAILGLAYTGPAPTFNPVLVGCIPEDAAAFGAGRAQIAAETILRSGLPSNAPTKQNVIIVATGNSNGNAVALSATNVGSTVTNRAGAAIYLGSTAAMATVANGSQVAVGASIQWNGPLFWAGTAAGTMEVLESLA